MPEGMENDKGGHNRCRRSFPYRLQDLKNFEGLHSSSRELIISAVLTRNFSSNVQAEVRTMGPLSLLIRQLTVKRSLLRKAVEELYITSSIERYAPSDRILHLGVGSTISISSDM